MHGVAEDDPAAPVVRQPVNAATVTMAENAASEERSFAFMFLEIGLIENENGCPVNLVIIAREIAMRIIL
jgi:hypothetical protein